jgi:hypothetical protein
MPTRVFLYFSEVRKTWRWGNDGFMSVSPV